MLSVKVVAKVLYSCVIHDEDEKKVRKYAELNKVSLEYAVKNLYYDGEIELYNDAVEIDVTTESISNVEEE